MPSPASAQADDPGKRLNFVAFKSHVSASVAVALMSRRPYKEPWQLRDALDYVRENAGTQFDPYWAKVLLRCEADLAEFYKENGE